MAGKEVNPAGTRKPPGAAARHLALIGTEKDRALTASIGRLDEFLGFELSKSVVLVYTPRNSQLDRLRRSQFRVEPGGQSMTVRSVSLRLAYTALAALAAIQVYAAVTESSTNVPLAIPDATNPGPVPGVVNSTLNFSVNGTITDANLTVGITHTWNDDIELRLTSPSVAAQLLFHDCGGSGDNFALTVDQDAAGLHTCPNAGPIGGSAQPTNGTAGAPVAATGSMNAFDGSMSGGVWTLNVTDDSNICTGTLDSWSLTLDGPPPLPVELTNFEVE